MESDSKGTSWPHRSTHQSTMEVGEPLISIICFYISITVTFSKQICGRGMNNLYMFIVIFTVVVCSLSSSIFRELQKDSKSANTLPHGQRSIMVGTKRVQATTNTKGAIRSGAKKRIRNKQLISLTEEEYNDVVANVHHNPEMMR